jgi:hypothetical protein
VLVTGPRPALSAGQRALAAAHGGRDLSLGHAAVHDPVAPLPASPVARIASGPAPRWSRPAGSAASRPTGALPGVSAYGDSVILGARASISARFGGGHMDAVEGRQADPILRDVARDARAGRLEPLVVIHVGDNGVIRRSQLRDTLALLRGVPRVILVNLHVDRPWQGPNNRAIARAAAGFANVRVLDWHRIAGAHPGWLFSDQIHLTRSGAQGYTALLVRAARAT